MTNQATRRLLAAICLAALCALSAESLPRAVTRTVTPQAAPRAAGVAIRVPDRGKAVRSILARPLFAATRRPPLVAAGGAAPQAAPPLLSGTLISPHGRVAVFRTQTGKAAARLQGQSIAGFVVEMVQPGMATLWDGRRHVRLTVRPDAASGGFVSSIDTALVAYPDNLPAPRLANRTVDGQREE